MSRQIAISNPILLYYFIKPMGAVAETIESNSQRLSATLFSHKNIPKFISGW